MLCNVGQATGFEKKDVLKLLEAVPKSVKLLKFIAEKGESHSFVVFDSTESAKIFHDTHIGTKVLNNGPIYMTYVESGMQPFSVLFLFGPVV